MKLNDKGSEQEVSPLTGDKTTVDNQAKRDTKESVERAQPGPGRKAKEKGAVPSPHRRAIRGGKGGRARGDGKSPAKTPRRGGRGGGRGRGRGRGGALGRGGRKRDDTTGKSPHQSTPSPTPTKRGSAPRLPASKKQVGDQAKGLGGKTAKPDGRKAGTDPPSKSTRSERRARRREREEKAQPAATGTQTGIQAPPRACGCPRCSEECVISTFVDAGLRDDLLLYTHTVSFKFTHQSPWGIQGARYTILLHSVLRGPMAQADVVGVDTCGAVRSEGPNPPPLFYVNKVPDLAVLGRRAVYLLQWNPPNEKGSTKEKDDGSQITWTTAGETCGLKAGMASASALSSAWFASRGVNWKVTATQGMWGFGQVVNGEVVLEDNDVRGGLNEGTLVPSKLVIATKTAGKGWVDKQHNCTGCSACVAQFTPKKEDKPPRSTKAWSGFRRFLSRSTGSASSVPSRVVGQPSELASILPLSTPALIYDATLAGYVAEKVVFRPRTSEVLRQVSRAASAHAKRINIHPAIRDAVLRGSITVGFARGVGGEEVALDDFALPVVGRTAGLRAWLPNWLPGSRTVGDRLATLFDSWQAPSRGYTGVSAIVAAFCVWWTLRRRRKPIGMVDVITEPVVRIQTVIAALTAGISRLATVVAGVPVTPPEVAAVVPAGLANIVLTPVLEELLRRAHPAVTPVIILFEAARRVWQAGWCVGLSQSIRPTLLHCIAANIPLRAAVVVHALYNWLVMSIGKATQLASTCVFRQDELLREPTFPSTWRHGSFRLLSTCYEEDGAHPLPHCQERGTLSGGDEDKCKGTVGCYLIGPALGSFLPFVNRSCVHNERRGIAGRILRAPLIPDPDSSPVVKAAWNRSYAAFRATSLFQRITGDAVVATPLAIWLSRFGGSTRARLESTIESGPYGQFTKRELAYEAFVKRETLVKHSVFNPSGSTHDPRIITGRSFPVRLATGPWTHAFGKRYSASAKKSHAYMSGMSAEDVGQWFVEAFERAKANCGPGEGVVLANGDHSRFDASVCVAPLLVLVDIERRAGAPPAQLEVARARTKKTGRSKSGVMYSVAATVGSGDGDTGSGNEAINQVAIHGLNADKPHLNHDDSHFSSLSMSDDFALVTSDSEWASQGGTQGVIAHFGRHNLRTKLSVGDSLAEVDICSGRLWPVEGGGWVFGPKPGRVFSKLFWSLQDVKGTKRERHIRGVCLGLETTVSYVPGVRALVKRLLELTAHLGRVPFVHRDRWEERVKASGTHTLDKDRSAAMVMQIYGISWPDIAAAEQEVALLQDTRPALLDSIVWARLAQVDWG